MSWKIDPFHTLVEFSVRHLGISIVKGRFKEVHGTLEIDPKYPENSSVSASVNSASIDTGAAQRDAHLRSANFFECSKYPLISFESTSIRVIADNRCVVTGNLTMHGVTRSVDFQVAYFGASQDPMTNSMRIGIAAVTIIDRRNFGMTFNQVLKTNVDFVSYETRIEINLEAVYV
ncbi:MAG TPA: YceI family protein [Ktedonobacteraceae bacterium]|jgi:polyisoprenoid-binding protein YceI|nr:YceI family protein [Ktedonobacteraceae bacterium]